MVALFCKSYGGVSRLRSHCFPLAQYPRQPCSVPWILALRNPPDQPPLLRLAVSATTELLRLISPNNRKDPLAPLAERPLADVEEVLDALIVDYQQSYFLTGKLTSSLYAEDCYFADPTISFTGRGLYERNLKLLVPFFDEPSITLFSLTEETDGSKIILANWRLRTYLKLPWRPLICVDGCTLYALNEDLKIVRHIESWSISPLQALRQLFIPGKKSS